MLVALGESYPKTCFHVPFIATYYFLSFRYDFAQWQWMLFKFPIAKKEAQHLNKLFCSVGRSSDGYSLLRRQFGILDHAPENARVSGVRIFQFRNLPREAAEPVNGARCKKNI